MFVKVCVFLHVIFAYCVSRELTKTRNNRIKKDIMKHLSLYTVTDIGPDRVSNAHKILACLW